MPESSLTRRIYHSNRQREKNTAAVHLNIEGLLAYTQYTVPRVRRTNSGLPIVIGSGIVVVY